MKYINLLLISLTVFIVSCDMDSFLYNSRKETKYTFPGNNIKDEFIEPVTLTSGGNKIYGYWIKSENPGTKYTILYCHGNKWGIDNYWDRVVLMHEMGFNVFIYDYRGYGMSEGESSEQGLHEDTDAALDFVQNQKKITLDSLCIYGFSLGNVCSIYLASEKVTPDCLIAEAPFASANSLTQGSVGLDLPPLWLTKGEYNNAEKIKNIKTRFFLIAGVDDDFVRFKDNGRIIYENAPNPKQLYLVPKALHGNIPETMGQDNYRKLIKDWILNK